MRILFCRFTVDIIKVESREIGFRERYSFFFFGLKRRSEKDTSS